MHERLRSYTYLYPAPPDESDDDDAIAIGNIFGDPVRAPKRAVQYTEMGFTGVKFDPVMPMGAFDPRQLSLEALSNAALVTKNIREAVGDKVDLLIGTHGQMTTSSAIRLAKRLEPIRWEEGYIIPPTKPGLGIELDEEVAARHAYGGGIFPPMADQPVRE